MRKIMGSAKVQVKGNQMFIYVRKHGCERIGIQKGSRVNYILEDSGLPPEPPSERGLAFARTSPINKKPKTSSNDNINDINESNKAAANEMKQEKTEEPEPIPEEEPRANIHYNPTLEKEKERLIQVMKTNRSDNSNYTVADWEGQKIFGRETWEKIKSECLG